MIMVSKKMHLSISIRVILELFRFGLCVCVCVCVCQEISLIRFSAAEVFCKVCVVNLTV